MSWAGDEKRAAYAAARARSLGRDLDPTLGKCGIRARSMSCGCVGIRRAPHVARPGPWAPTAPVEFTCRQHLVCERCNRKRSAKLKGKMGAALQHHLDEARAAWVASGCPTGGKPQVVLMTFSVRHSGDVEADRRAIQEGWREFYRRLKRRGLAMPYCGAWEATSGRDGLGHVHLHMAIVWPFVDFKAVIRWWKASCPVEGSVDLAWRRRDGKPTNGWSAARYIGKYISKGVQLGGVKRYRDGQGGWTDVVMSDELAADIVAASYNQRSVMASSKFWVAWARPCCPRCGVLPWPELPLAAQAPDVQARAVRDHRVRCESVLAERYGPERARWLSRASVPSARLSLLAELPRLTFRVARDGAGTWSAQLVTLDGARVVALSPGFSSERAALAAVDAEPARVAAGLSIVDGLNVRRWTIADLMQVEREASAWSPQPELWEGAPAR